MVAYAVVVLALVFIGMAIAFFSPLRALDPGARIPPAMFGGVPFLLALIALPIGAAVAILRYRLYDIDLVINRTIVYGLLTAVLGGGFVAAQNVVPRAVAASVGVSSEVVTVGMVFAVAALFTPLRARLQAAVDRRFKAARPPDADKPGEAVVARLRSLTQLRDEGLITPAEYEAKRQDVLAQL